MLSILAGRLIDKESLDIKQPTTITTASEWNEEADFHVLSGRKSKCQPERNTMFTCLDRGCVGSFETAANLEDHLIIGACNLQLIQERSTDQVKYVYADKLQVWLEMLPSVVIRFLVVYQPYKEGRQLNKIVKQQGLMKTKNLTYLRNLE
jgi:hypothetical protein